MDIYLKSEFNNRILCHYINLTNQIQIAKITNIPNWYFEKVVFPKERIIFVAFPEAILEVHTEIMTSAIFSKQIQCYLLCVKEQVNQLDLKSEVA